MSGAEFRLPSLMAATKALASTPNWVEFGDQFNFVIWLDIDGVTQVGLRLRGKCSRDLIMTSRLDEKTSAFREIVDSVARALAETRHVDEASFIHLPVIYPRGSTVTVRMTKSLLR